MNAQQAKDMTGDNPGLRTTELYPAHHSVDPVDIGVRHEVTEDGDVQTVPEKITTVQQYRDFMTGMYEPPV